MEPKYAILKEIDMTDLPLNIYILDYYIRYLFAETRMYLPELRVYLRKNDVFCDIFINQWFISFFLYISFVIIDYNI